MAFGKAASANGFGRRAVVSRKATPSPHPHGSSDAKSSSSPSSFHSPKNNVQKLYAAIGCMALVCMYATTDPELSPYLSPTYYARNLLPEQVLRRLAIPCIHNIYIPPEEAETMPVVPGFNEAGGELPSYITICKEWQRRDWSLDSADADLGSMLVGESDRICTDWRSPHYSFLEMLSSTILSKVVPRMKYKHKCDRTRNYDEITYGYDHSTVQQMFAMAGMSINHAYLTEDSIKDLCRVCLAGYNGAEESQRVTARSAHHCFGWPETPIPVAGRRLTEDGEIEVVPELEEEHRRLQETTPTDIVLPKWPTSNAIIPVVAVFGPPPNLRLPSRFYNAAIEWSNVTDAPPKERETGVVIAIDVASYGIDPAYLDPYVPEEASSITVLINPLCSDAAHLPTGQQCLSYANLVKNHFANKQAYENLTDTGYDGAVGVDVQIATSTAGAFSRMALSRTLVCLPGTISCLLPSLAKQRANSYSVILESPNWGQGSEWFSYVSSLDGHIRVVMLPGTYIPPLLSAEQIPPPPEDTPPALQVPPADPDGRPLDAPEPPPTPTLEELNSMPPEQEKTLAADNTGVPVDEAPAGTKSVPNQKVPTQEEAEAADLADEPLNTNYNHKDGANNYDYEMALDLSMDNLVNPPLTQAHFGYLGAQRSQSVARIYPDNVESTENVLQTTTNGDYPPSLQMEVQCPSETAGGNQISYLADSVVTIRPDTVVVSDPIGTLSFDASKITTQFVNETQFIVTETASGQTIYDTDAEPTHLVNVPTDATLITATSNMALDTTDGSTVVVRKRDTDTNAFVLEKTGKFQGYTDSSSESSSSSSDDLGPDAISSSDEGGQSSSGGDSYDDILLALSGGGGGLRRNRNLQEFIHNPGAKGHYVEPELGMRFMTETDRKRLCDQADLQAVTGRRMSKTSATDSTDTSDSSDEFSVKAVHFFEKTAEEEIQEALPARRNLL